MIVITNPRLIRNAPFEADDITRCRQYLLDCARPQTAWRLGLEMELLGFQRDTWQRIDASQVQNLMQALAKQSVSQTVEDGAIIALELAYGAITLEPGGQFEFSSLPRERLIELENDLCAFIEILRPLAEARSMAFLACGFDPLRSLDEQRWISKRRYAIMRPYLGARGARAWDMMARTAALQVSVDYGDEGDMRRKFVLGNRLGPIVAAMFANSPFVDGRQSGLKSSRYVTWLETDPDRCGIDASTTTEPFVFDQYLKAVLDTPAIFLERDGTLIECAQKLRNVDDLRFGDFLDLLSTIFTEARLRGNIEMRSADGGPIEAALALSAFWKGLTYDAATLRHALAFAPLLDVGGFRELQRAVARDGLQARCLGVDVGTTARIAVQLAVDGLAAVAPDEVPYLDSLCQRVLEDDVSPADIALQNARGDVRRFMEHARII